MSRQFARAGFGKERTSLYQEITNKIIAELEAGRAPWVQPWGAATRAPLDMPRNAASGRRYSGINILILWDAVIEGGFSGQNWLTFRQALALGGQRVARYSLQQAHAVAGEWRQQRHRMSVTTLLLGEPTRERSATRSFAFWSAARN